MAISASSYGVGNRLYKGATSAPTRGRVDPTGYIDRELNNVASRSGIAASALRRMGTPAQRASGASAGMGQDENAYGQQTQTAISGQTRGLGGGVSDSMPGRSMNQGLTVTGPGKLQAPQLARDGGIGLPFDPDAADAQTRALGQKNRFESDFTTAQQNLERQYADSIRGLERERPQNERAILENYAGRGLAYSSGYSYDQGELQNEYARFRGELDQGKTEGFADLLRQRGLFNDEYAGLLNSIQQAAARRAAAQAAELELGVTPGQDSGPAPEPQQQFDPTPQPQAIPYIAPSVAQSAPSYDYSSQAQAAASPTSFNISPAVMQILNSGQLTGRNVPDYIPQPAPAPQPIAAPVQNYSYTSQTQAAAPKTAAAIDPNILKLLMSGSLSGRR